MIDDETSGTPQSGPKPETSGPTYNYTASLISYFDILGMKDLLMSAATDAGKVASVLNVFRQLSEPASSETELWTNTFVNFSDLVVRVLPLDSKNNQRYRLGSFFHEFTQLGFIQINLIHRGILVRGAITIGQVCHADGPSLV